MANGIGICPFCTHVVTEAERPVFEVIGWEEGRRQGGTNAIRLRNRTSAVAHWYCVDRIAHGREGQLQLAVPSGTQPTERRSE
jgi:hypothetical protein